MWKSWSLQMQIKRTYWKSRNYQVNIILRHKGSDDRSSKEWCLFPNSKYPERKAGHCVFKFSFFNQIVYSPTGARETNRAYHCHIFTSHTEGKKAVSSQIARSSFTSIHYYHCTLLWSGVWITCLYFFILLISLPVDRFHCMVLGPKSIITNFRKLIHLTQNINF